MSTPRVGIEALDMAAELLSTASAAFRQGEPPDPLYYEANRVWHAIHELAGKARDKWAKPTRRTREGRRG